MAPKFIAVTAIEKTKLSGYYEPIGMVIVNTDEIAMVICGENRAVIVMKDYATKIITKESGYDIYMQINDIHKTEKERKTGNGKQTENRRR